MDHSHANLLQTRAAAQRGMQGHLFVTAGAGGAAAGVSEPVKVDGAGGVGRVRALHKGKQALDGLQVLARGLVVHDVRAAVHDVGNLFARRPLVDAHARHPNRPGVVPCTQPHLRQAVSMEPEHAYDVWLADGMYIFCRLQSVARTALWVKATKYGYMTGSALHRSQ